MSATDTPWLLNADGDWSRHYRGHRLEVLQDGDLSWSWQAWRDGSDWEPEADGEASSELTAKLAAERAAEQGAGPATDAARLTEDAEVTP